MNIWELIPKEKQIEVELTIENFTAEGTCYREGIEESIVEQLLTEEEVIAKEEVEKEQKETKTKTGKRQRKVKIVTFPEKDFVGYLVKTLNQKLKGLFNDVGQRLYLCCLTKNYKPINKEWIFEITNISEIGKVETRMKMVPRNLKKKIILVPEYRDFITQLKLDLKLANLRFPKKNSGDLLKKSLVIAQTVPFGAWRTARITSYKIK